MSRYVGEPAHDGEFVITDVTVVDPADGTASAGQSIRIKDGLIVAVTSATRSSGPSIDGRGQWVIPGLVDMHSHVLNTPDDVDGAYALMLANGVVGFRQMSGSSSLLSARRRGALPSPSGAPALLATAGDLLTPMNASTPDAAVATVRHQHAEGADFIKAAIVGREAFLAALDEGRRIGIPVVGHLPDDVDPRVAAARGMRSIEHLGPGHTVFAAASDREAEVRAAAGAGRRLPPMPKAKLPGMDRLMGRIIRNLVVNPSTQTSEKDARTMALADTTFDEAAAAALAEIFVQRDTWQCPTLIRMHTQEFPAAPEHRADPRRRYMAPSELKLWDKAGRKFDDLPSATRDALEEHWEAQLRMTALFANAGVPMMAGTDAGGASGVIPGFALHDEFELLALAGLDPLVILRMATSDPARFLHRTASAGRIAAGMEADLVLLSADPLADHRALHSITGVVRGGGYWGREQLDGVLTAVAARPGAR